MEIKQYKDKIQKEEINAMPVENYEGRIIIINNLIDLQKCLRALSLETMVGIDTETRPNFKKGSAPNKVALLQIATEKYAFLIRLNEIGLPQDLIDFLENKTIKKIGISLKDDLHAMRRTGNINDTTSFIDLQQEVKIHGIEDQSLQKIYAIIFGKKISKKQRLTNWEAPELTPQQQEYAALDAWACLKIYNELTNE